MAPRQKNHQRRNTAVSGRPLDGLINLMRAFTSPSNPAFGDMHLFNHMIRVTYTDAEIQYATDMIAKEKERAASTNSKVS